MNRRIQLWIIGGFLALGFIVYGRSLGNDFVLWDDSMVIYSNPIIRGVNPHNIAGAFTTFDPELYVPFTVLSYQIDYTIGELNPTVYHVHSLFWHCIASIVLAFILIRLSSSTWAGVIGGLLFLLHPLQVESVAWASARKDVLCAAFFFGSVLSYLRYKDTASTKIYWLSVGLFVSSLLSKVTAVSLPLVLLLLDYIEHRPFTKQSLMEKLPYLAASLVFGVVAIIGKAAVVSNLTLWDVILLAIRSMTLYAGKLVWPSYLSVLYPAELPISISTLPYLLSTIAAGVAIICVLLLYRRFRTFSASMAIVLLLLIPSTTNVFKGLIVFTGSDRYMYLPMFGILIATSALLARIEQKSWRTWGMGVCVCVLMIVGAVSYRQSMVWNNTETLFLNTLQRYPTSITARTNLGVYYRKAKRPVEAKAMLEQALTYGTHPRIFTALASLAMDEGDFNEALRLSKEGERIEPRDPEPIYGQALAYAGMGKTDDAIAAYNRVIDVQKNHVAAMNNLAALLLSKGQQAEAEHLYRRILELDPYFPDTHYNLAILLSDKQLFQEAAKHFEAALDERPQDLEALRKLLKTYAELNDKKNTIRTAKRILVLAPNDAIASQLLERLR